MVLRGADYISKGNTLMFVDGYTESAIVIITDRQEERSLEEPPTSAVLKGPRKGFNENIKINISLIRKIISSPSLESVPITIGTMTKTQISVMYIKKITNKEIVDKIVSRIKKIKIDGILDSYYIAQFLQERPKSIFKQIGMSEKPDIVCAKMLEGRVAVLVDGSPIVLTLPFILVEDFHSADDYYSQQYRVIAIRLLRVVSVFLTVVLPGLYVATQLFHYRAIPLRFLVSILNSTQGLPLTPFSEMLLVIVLFEILYEASLRMPKYLGLALSIVGALILGDTAVKAGLISPPSVMVVAISGIAIYTIPEQSDQLSMFRIFYTLAGGILGFYGLMLVTVFIFIYLSDFDNYGAPYLAPFSPKISSDKTDAIFKENIINDKKRPRSIPNNNLRRGR